MFANAWKVYKLLDAILLQYFLRAYPRSFKNRRGTKGSCRYDHQPRGLRNLYRSVGASSCDQLIDIFDPCCTGSSAWRLQNPQHEIEPKKNTLEDNANNAMGS